MTGPRALPRADEATTAFWAAAAEHRLVAPRCTDCGRWQWPPEDVCGDCGGGARTWVELSGRGRVYSWIVDHRNLVPGFSGAYLIALVVPVEVDDDTVRLVTNLPGSRPEDVWVGMEVDVVWEQLAPGVVLPQFAAPRPTTR